MYSWIKKLLFLFPAETSHNFAFFVGKLLQRIGPLLKFLFPETQSKKNIELAGLKFPSPIGLAAGFDKNAELLELLSRCGFGFMEVGTVTPLAQVGSTKPRLFRFTKHKAILNRMGFNNKGQDYIAKKIEHKKPRLNIPIGVNIGKNKCTPNDEAVLDYGKGFSCFKNLADYFVVNLSSPNTPGLRDLQSKEFLQELKKTAADLGVEQAIFVKLAPDLGNHELQGLCQDVEELGFAGLILTNTTVEREQEVFASKGAGGISGDPLCIRSRECLLLARRACTLPIISVGGILNFEEVEWRLKNGASLVQVYSALIFEGPSEIRRWSQLWQNI